MILVDVEVKKELTDVVCCHIGVFDTVVASFDCVLRIAYITVLAAMYCPTVRGTRNSGLLVDISYVC